MPDYRYELRCGDGLIAAGHHSCFVPVGELFAFPGHAPVFETGRVAGYR